MSILVFGGAGFIGTNFVNVWMDNSKEEIIVFDKLTYASNFKQVQNFKKSKRYFFFKGDIKNRTQVSKILKKFKPRKVINLLLSHMLIIL